MDTLWYILYGYVVLVLVKSILCYASIPTVIWVLRSRLGHGNTVFRFVGLVVTIPFAVACFIPQLLREEGLSFFVVYPNKKVIKDIFNAF